MKQIFTQYDVFHAQVLQSALQILTKFCPFFCVQHPLTPVAIFRDIWEKMS